MHYISYANAESKSLAQKPKTAIEDARDYEDYAGDDWWERGEQDFDGHSDDSDDADPSDNDDDDDDEDYDRKAAQLKKKEKSRTRTYREGGDGYKGMVRCFFDRRRYCGENREWNVFYIRRERVRHPGSSASAAAPSGYEDVAKQKARDATKADGDGGGDEEDESEGNQSKSSKGAVGRYNVGLDAIELLEGGRKGGRRRCERLGFQLRPNSN